MRHFLTFGILILVLGGCGKEKEMEVPEPEWSHFCIIMGNTIMAWYSMDSGIADSFRCQFYINDLLKQEGKGNYFTYEIVRGDSLLIYKSFTFLGNRMWVDMDTTRIAYYEPEKIVVNIVGEVIK